MWVELLLSCVPFFVSYVCWQLLIDEVMLLTFTALSCSFVGLLLWAYSRYLSGIYQEERLLRMKIRRERIVGRLANFNSLKNETDFGSNLGSSAEKSESKSTADSSKSCLILDDDGGNKDMLPRKVLRLSPVFPALLSVIQGALSVVIMFGAAFMVARIVSDIPL